MKIVLKVALALLVVSPLSAQNIEVKTNPVGFAFGATNLSIEAPLPDRKNITLNASVWHYNAKLKEWMDLNRNYGASLGVRRYLTSDIDQGLYLGMTTRYIDRTLVNYYWDQTSASNIKVETPSDYTSLGFMTGYKFIFNDRITIDAFAGAGRILNEFGNGSSDVPAEWIAGLNFGYRL